MNHGASTARCGRGRRCTVGRLQEKPVSVLFGDESIVPVRGQLARTIPQPDIHYGLAAREGDKLSRRKEPLVSYRELVTIIALARPSISGATSLSKIRSITSALY